MSNPRYPWIITRTRRRVLPPDRPRTYPADQTCARCGYNPVGRRKKCPACLVRLDTDAGHVGSADQWLWLVFLILAILFMLRALGVNW